MTKKLKILIMGPEEFFPGCPVNPTLETKDFFAQDGHEVWCSMDPAEVEKADLTMVPGGLPDVDPALYGEENQGSHDVTREMDDEQFAMIRRAFELKKPIVGICRGFQLINVYLGGSLVQDIESADFHRFVAEEPIFHRVYNVEGTKLAELFGESMKVNSGHHQALKRMPEEFKVTQLWCDDEGRRKEYLRQAAAGELKEGSSDCIIEAVEHKSYPLIGFQWHPEMGGDMYCKHLDLGMIRQYCYSLVR